jgi:molybdenum cofactor cytidylyltransferase
MIPAVVLAAGESLRMGQPKALLAADAAGTTFVRRLIKSLSLGGCEEVIVVLGHGADRIAADIERADTPVRMVENPQWPLGQLASLLVGLDTIDRPGVAGVLVALVDAPFVSAATVARLRRVHRETGALIVRPVRQGRHGHPVLFDRRLFGELRRADPTRGATVVVRAHADAILDVEVDDEGAFHDIDTPEDYARLGIVTS